MTLKETENFIIEHIGNEKKQAGLFEKADKLRQIHYGKEVFLRGLIEISSYCRRNCYYCGLRRDNSHTHRYRLSNETILSCVSHGYEMGFRTFVLQGGEDGGVCEKNVCDVVSKIKEKYPNCAVTLSLGEFSKEIYKSFHDAGADRYLLRHETANAEHYALLHPSEQSLENRKKCLYDLKEIGFQVGAGLMVGSPWQTISHLAQDLEFLQDLKPHMVGIGPFMPHKDTPFRDKAAGSLEMTLIMLAMTRILLPEVLLPATTALGSLHPDGRRKGLQAGANVVMPNLSPKDVRVHYNLYDGKLSTGLEAVEGLKELFDEIEKAGYKASLAVGNHVSR